MEDLNRKFLNYLILLLNMGYTILRMEHNCKMYYFILVRMSQMLQFNSEHYTKCRFHNVISFFNQKCVYLVQETGVDIHVYVLFLFRKRNDLFKLVIISDRFISNFM